MKFKSRKTGRALCFLIFIGLSVYMVAKSILIVEDFEKEIIWRVDVARNKSISEIERSAMLFMPFDVTASNLARGLNVFLNETDKSFAMITSKIAPSLFQALSTIPHVSVVSFTALDGQSFSYYINRGVAFERYVNISSPSVSHVQPVDRDTGKPYKNANNSTSMFFDVGNLDFNSTSTKARFTSRMGMDNASAPESRWNSFDNLFVDVPMGMKGNISIGFPKQYVADHFAELDFSDEDFQLITADNQIVVPSMHQYAKTVVDNGTTFIASLNLHSDAEGNVTRLPCNLNDSALGKFDVRRKQHNFHCSTITVAGIKMVYTLTFPTEGTISTAHKNSNLAFILLVLTLVILVVSVAVFFILIVRASQREVVLCAALIRQTESTQQAERKSMNKSRAFNNATHDVRASLIAIKGLVEVCHRDAKQDSELANNLTQIDAVAEDLKGLLNSVLDTSKIEAGKMKLEAEEFDLATMMEDVAYIHYPLGLKKGVDVILDHCDGSILKYNFVKGDKGKLKQILCNLLGNAIKFTSQGYVVVRTVVRKQTNENAIIASNRVSALECLSRLCLKTNGSLNSLDELQIARRDPNCMEFIFEVDDTGCGIPKERQNSVFEYFVQVKETSSGQEGSGLGLGIVQSLVRLMGGEIRIIDKGPGERGTCFRFNVFLTTCNVASSEIEDNGNYMHNGGSPMHVLHYIGLHIRSPMPRLEGSHVILLVNSEEREKIARRVMESFGIKVAVAKSSKDLPRILDMLVQKSDLLLSPSSEKIELGPADHVSFSGARNPSLNEGSLCTKDGYDHTLPQSRRSNSKGLPIFIVVVIDANVGPLLELYNVVSNIRKETQNIWCKVVWVEDPITRAGNPEEGQKDHPNPPCDYILSRPLHGLLLYQVMAVLPEFNGAFPINIPKLKAALGQENEQSSELKGSNTLVQVSCDSNLSDGKKDQLKEILVHKNIEKVHHLEPLNGKSVLVVDDSAVLRKFTSATLTNLGAKVDTCENGKEAYDLVCKLLNDQEDVHPKSLPYNYICMDSEMPVMNGPEATKLIRMEEKKHGLRFTIFALTAHSMNEEDTKHFCAEMDFHLSKPLQVDKLLDAIKWQ